MDPEVKRAFDDMFGRELSTLRNVLRARLEAHLSEMYLRGAAQMVHYGYTKLGRPIVFEGPPMREAITWAQRHSAELVTRMDDETKRRLGSVVADAIDNKGGVEQLSRDIRREFQDMSRRRSETIARTETAKALTEGSISRAMAMDVTGKEVVVTPFEEWPCDICEDNAAVGPIRMDDEFPSGDMGPPFHPNCACALAYIMLPDSAGEE